LRVIADGFRRGRPRSRVIVTFLDDTAGPERYFIGHAPAGDEPVIATGGPSWLATFDFPRPSPAATTGAP
jgi:hypothetical protein